MTTLSSALNTGDELIVLEISGSFEPYQGERGHRAASSASTANGSSGNWLLCFVGLRRE